MELYARLITLFARIAYRTNKRVVKVAVIEIFNGEGSGNLNLQM